MRLRIPRSSRWILTLAGIAIVLTVLVAIAGRQTPTGRAEAAPSIAAYHGLGSWIDIHDSHAWEDPEAAVADMDAHGVRTIFLQTGNSTQKDAVFRPAGQVAFIRAAHARGMKAVAWYLPDMVDVAFDYGRVAQAIGFRTSDGQRFDSFALDIESISVKDERERNRALDTLTRKIRALAGPSYPLGAIIPSPVSLAKKAGHWDAFPYESVAAAYDVILPMGYWTYDGKGASVATSDSLGNVRILRDQPGCSKVPVHLIGGLAHKSSAAEVQAFVSATRKADCVGASLYDWAGTSSADWDALKGVNP